MVQAAIAVRDLTVKYHTNQGEVTALNNVSFELQPGVICGLVGVNGSGKTTLFKALLGFVGVTAGSVALLGVDPLTARKKSLVAYMPQKERIDNEFPITVTEVVMTGRYAFMGFTRKPKQRDKELVQRAIEQVGLADYAGRQISSLSGGQLKRVFLARAIAGEAKVLLLDEPFAGVDPASEHTIRQVLNALAAEGATVLVSTHNLAHLAELAHEALLLRGELLMHDSARVVLQPENLARGFGIELRAGGAK